MKLSMLLAPRLDLKYVSMALFVYLIITAALLVGPARSFQAATSLDWGVTPQKVSASNLMEEQVVPNIVFQTPVVTIPAPPYIIVEPAN